MTNFLFKGAMRLIFTYLLMCFVWRVLVLIKFSKMRQWDVITYYSQDDYSTIYAKSLFLKSYYHICNLYYLFLYIKLSLLVS